MDKEDLKYWIWFLRIKNLNSIQKLKLLEKYISPKVIWGLNKNDLNIENKFKDEILKNEYKKNLELYEKYIVENGIEIINIFSKEYPNKLNYIYDKPIALFVKGNKKLLNKESIAIVGCRQCSEYGKKVAYNLSLELAQEGKCIVSGLAKGIDKYAHLGALNSTGNTIAVMGSGIDIVYPSENRKIYEKILSNNGLVVSEYIIGTKPEKFNFPARNRIISGLSDGIVIVEARKKSGALITAEFGIEHGKEVFAVPGNIDSLNSMGTNELIKQGAILVTNSKDIIEGCYSFKHIT